MGVRSHDSCWRGTRFLRGWPVRRLPWLDEIGLRRSRTSISFRSSLVRSRRAVREISRGAPIAVPAGCSRRQQSHALEPSTKKNTWSASNAAPESAPGMRPSNSKSRRIPGDYDEPVVSGRNVGVVRRAPDPASTQSDRTRPACIGRESCRERQNPMPCRRIPDRLCQDSLATPHADPPVSVDRACSRYTGKGGP